MSQGPYMLVAYAEKSDEPRSHPLYREIIKAMRSILHFDETSAYSKAFSIIRRGKWRIENGTFGDMKALRQRFEAMLPGMFFDVKENEEIA